MDSSLWHPSSNQVTLQSLISPTSRIMVASSAYYSRGSVENAVVGNRALLLHRCTDFIRSTHLGCTEHRPHPLCCPHSSVLCSVPLTLIIVTSRNGKAELKVVDLSGNLYKIIPGLWISGRICRPGEAMVVHFIFTPLDSFSLAWMYVLKFGTVRHRSRVHNVKRVAVLIRCISKW